MTQLVRKHVQNVTPMCVYTTKGPVQERLLFHFIVRAVQIIAPESMRENIKINLFTDVVVSFNPVAE